MGARGEPGKATLSYGERRNRVEPAGFWFEPDGTNRWAGHMTFAELANPGILTQPVYEPGKPIDQVARELGLDPAGIVKLASNENPHGPSPKAVAAAACRRWPSRSR